MTTRTSETPEPWSNRRWLAWGVWPIIALAVALAVQWQINASPVSSGATSLNRTIFTFINQTAAPWPASAWSALTMLGDASLLLALFSPLLLFRPQVLAAVLAAVPLGGLLSVALKRTFDAPRPAAVLEAAQIHVIGPLLSAHSFPSGHTIASFAAAIAALAVLQRPLRCGGSTAGHFAGVFAIVISVACGVGISRVAVGAHWPVDVLAGAGVGWVAGLSGAAASRRWPQLWQPVASQRRLMMILIGIAAWLLWRPVDYPLGAPVVWLSVVSVVMTAFCMWMRTKQA